MIRTLLLPALLSAATAAHAQTGPAPDDDERGAYLSTQLGNGLIRGDGAIGNRQMRWRAFELRAGRDLNPDLVGEDSLTGRTTTRLDIVYYNEGHPDNNHRDGFAFQYTYARRLGTLTAELSAGPYTSMNTTVVNGEQIDQARYGVLASAALRIPLDRWWRGTHLRIGYNHVWMRNVAHSDALMVGIGRHFTDTPPFPESALERQRVWWGLSYGRSYTSQSNTQNANGAIVQARQVGGKWASSVSLVAEGDDQVRVDRRGVAAQFWFVQPLTPRWTASAGIGPYLAQNRRDHNHVGVHGLFTMQFERLLTPHTSAFFAFHRVKTYREENDRDLFHLGVLTHFGP